MNCIYSKKSLFLLFFVCLFCLKGFSQKKLQEKSAKDKSGQLKWGLVNKRGKVVVPYEYDTVFTVYEDAFAAVGKFENDTLKAGVINKKNKVVLPFNFQNIKHLNELLLVQGFNKSWGVLDKDFNEIVSARYKSFSYNSSQLNLSPYYKWKVIKPDGSIVIEVSADSLGVDNGEIICFTNGSGSPVKALKLSESLQTVSDNIDSCDFAGLPDSDINIIDSLSAGYDSVFSFSEGYVGVVKGGYYGFTDTSGKIRISLQYENAKGFSEGLAPVKILGKWAYINKNEDFVVQPAFESATPFCGGTALVKLDGEFNFIDKKGRLRNAQGYDSVYRVSNGNWKIIKGDKVGLGNQLGREIIIPKYESLEDLGNGFVIVKKHGLSGVLDYNQNIIIPVLYDQVLFNSSGIFFVRANGENKILNLEEISD